MVEKCQTLFYCINVGDLDLTFQIMTIHAKLANIGHFLPWLYNCISTTVQFSEQSFFEDLGEVN